MSLVAAATLTAAAVLPPPDGAAVHAALDPSARLCFSVAGEPGDAAIVNVTPVRASGVGNGQLVSSDVADAPVASNVNFAAGTVDPNVAIAPIGADGRVCFVNSQDSRVDLVADHLGTIAAGSYTPGSPDGAPLRKLDTRGGGPPSLAAQLLRFPAGHRAIGVDRIAVWSCDTPESPESFADTARAQATSYFATASRGRYTVEFTPVGSITTQVGEDCLEMATSMTASPYTNVLVVGGYRNDQGGPGRVPCCLDPNLTVLDVPPSVSERGLALTRGFGNLEHEIGHTLHWPHSDSTGWNEIDVMGYGNRGHTLAFNRFANGWIDDDQVVVHTRGRTAVTLAPPATTGTQFVAALDVDDRWKVLTVEARPDVGLDADIAKSGVAVHVIDQTSSSWFGHHRRQGPAVPPDHDGTWTGVEHVLAPGEALTIDGVTVTVVSQTGNSYDVVVEGQYDG